MPEALNQCATSFGGVYDFYIERPRLSRLIGRVIWGVDLRPMYADIAEIGDLEEDSVVADVPCGGGLALRGLSPASKTRFIGVDIDAKMLARMREKAEARGLAAVETVEADMRALPFEDASIDRLYSFSGLHMINDPERAAAEFARVLKPGARLVGSSFVADGSRRKRFLTEREVRRVGIAAPPRNAASVRSMLERAGFSSVEVTGRGFVNFSAVRG
jgi:ubiquinone/menaquinone biosynthesis C-methylase UbiE